jgi:PAS domain S-box-containing protein
MNQIFESDDAAVKSELLDLLLRATQDGIVDWNLQSGEVTYNARWKHLLGYDSDEYAVYCDRPEAWRDLMHPEDAPRTLQLVDDHLTQGWPLVTTVRMRHYSGGYRHVLVRGAAKRDRSDTAVRLVLIFSDIDERIRSEERQRALVAALPDTLFRVRRDGTVLSLKRGLEREGSPFAALAEGTSLEESLTDSALLERLRAALVQACEGEQGALTLSLRTSGPAQHVSHHEVRIVRSGDDEAVCIVRDVTEQRDLEDRLLQTQKLGAIGQLAAGVAHEINTPMQFIGDNLHFARAGIADLLTLLDLLRTTVDEARQAPASEAKQAELAQAEIDLDFEYTRDALPTAIERSLTGVDRVTKIVRAMKAFAHPDGDQLTPTDLKSLIESTVMVATNEWKYVAEVELEFEPNLPPVPCLGGELNQVILNLIVNAAHAIGDVVGSSGEKGRIAISTERDATHACIRVADSGTGIPEEIRAKVFEPFFTTKEVGRGTGQGLAMAYNCVVKRHKGTIHFETELGKGTTFVIRLPLNSEVRSSGAPQ